MLARTRDKLLLCLLHEYLLHLPWGHVAVRITTLSCTMHYHFQAVNRIHLVPSYLLFSGW